jgi:hypothetical protein
MNSDSDRQARANTRNIEQACRMLGSQMLAPDGGVTATLRDVYCAAASVWGVKHAKFGSTFTKDQKVAAEDLEQALRRLERALKNPDLADDLREAVPLKIDLNPFDIDLKPGRRQCDGSRGFRLGPGPQSSRITSKTHRMTPLATPGQHRRA